MSESELVTVVEAAALLGVPRDKITRLIKVGALTARPSTLDARRKLIPRAEIDDIIRKEGGRPAKKLVRSSRAGIRPRSIGIATGGSPPAEEIDEYLRQDWRPE